MSADHASAQLRAEEARAAKAQALAKMYRTALEKIRDFPWQGHQEPRLSAIRVAYQLQALARSALLQEPK